MKFLCTLFSVISLFSARAAFDSLRSETRGELVFVIHEVEEEETLYSIARRYKSSVPSIIEYNRISDNRIEIGQVISVLYNVLESNTEAPTETPQGFHLVEPGETLYSISKIYDLRIRDIRRLNKLQSNDISPGEYLRVVEADSSAEPQEEETREEIPKPDDGIDIPEGFETYIVQTAETLNSIARKRKISVSDLKEWNNLDSDYIRIGQTLLVRTLVDSIETSDENIEPGTRLDENGFEKVYEEGIAGVITDIYVEIDTLGTVPVRDSLFTKAKWPKFNLETLAIVPGVSPETKFLLWADKIKKAGVDVNVIEVVNPRPVDPNRDEESEYNTRKPLRFGSRTSVTTAGNWE